MTAASYERGEHAGYIERIQCYMEKASREAKIHTTWINPNAEYDQALQRLVASVLEPSPDNAFLENFRQFQAPIAKAGIWNSISQVLLKGASPGMPDFYQGNEFWCFDLVDPDNRRPVNFESRRLATDSVVPFRSWMSRDVEVPHWPPLVGQR